MTNWKVPLADLRVTEEDIDAIADVYRSGWLSMGPQTEGFEQALSAYVGTATALATANGTAALHLICAAAGLSEGDEVVVPAMTFVATVNAIAYTGAQPVFADITSIDQPWLSTDAAQAAIGPRTQAIMTMTYGGDPGHTVAIAELAAAHSLPLLIDAAHAIGSRIDGRHVSSFGHATAFSFFSNKNLPVGEGGALLTDDDELARRARLLRSHGMTTLTWDRHRGHAAGYDVVDLGFNYRLDEPRAALARRRLIRLDAENTARSALDERYRTLLAHVDGVQSVRRPVPGCSSSHHLYVVVVDEAIDRDRFRSLLAEQGIQTSLHYPPAHRFSIYADNAPDLPLTEAFAQRAVTLPLFPHMTHAQQDSVVEAVAQSLPVAAR